MIEVDGKYVIFAIGGGAGYHLQATVPLRGIREKYPDRKIIVVCAYPGIFHLNPNVDEVYMMGRTPHFMDHFLTEEKGIPMRAQPYFHPDYLYKKKHLAECWCEMLDVPRVKPLNGSDDLNCPDFILSKAEERDSKEFCRSKNGPTLLVQYAGGAPGQVNEKGQIIQAPPKMFVRNLPMKTARNVAEDMREAGYYTMVIAKGAQQVWNTAERIEFPLRMTLGLIKHASKLLLIDSVGQHAAAALGRQAVVCWAGTSPDVLGYPCHINLRQKECETPECHRPNSFFFDEHSVAQWQCPYGEPCVENYDEQDILDALAQCH